MDGKNKFDWWFIFFFMYIQLNGIFLPYNLSLTAHLTIKKTDKCWLLPLEV